MKNSTKMSIPVIPTKTILLMLNEAEDKQCSNRMHAQNSRFRRPGTRITFNRQQLSYPSGDFFMPWKLWSLWTQRKMLAVTEGRDALPRPAVHSRLTWKLASAEPNCRRTLRWSLTCSMLAWAAPSEQEAGHTEQKHHVSVEGLDTQSKNIMCQWRGWTHRAKTSCVSGGAGHTEQKHHVSVEGLDTQSESGHTDQKHHVSHAAKTSCVTRQGGHTEQNMSVEEVDTRSKNIMCHWRGWTHTYQKHHVSLEWVETHISKTSCVTGVGGDTVKTCVTGVGGDTVKTCVTGGSGDTAKTCVTGGGGDTAKTSCVTGGGGDTYQKHHVSLEWVETHISKTSCVTGGGGDTHIKNIMCHWRGWRHTYQKHHVSLEWVETHSKNIMCHWRGWRHSKNMCHWRGWRHSKNIMCHWRGWRHSKNIMCHWRG